MRKSVYTDIFKNEFAHPWYQVTRQLLVHSLDKHLTKKSLILDIGCGTGGTITVLKKEKYKNITGIDNNLYAVKLARKRGHKIIYSDIHKLPFEANKFDAVICLDVLYHKGIKTNTVLKRAYRVLKPGGLFYSQEPSYNWLRGKHDKAIFTRHRFTKKELKTNISNAKYIILKSFYFNSIFLPLIILKRTKEYLSGSKEITSDISALPILIAKITYIVLNIELKLIRLFQLPFGLSIVIVAKK